MLVFNSANITELRAFDMCFSHSVEGYLKVLTAVC